jgi:acyl-CoA reductase-like NAD-dependent aldehyde dehydrogenase
MAALSSYVAGKWHTPTEAGAPIYDASTGEQVASASSAGIDFGAVVAHARTLGGPALRALTFQQRAAALRALGDYLRANREDLYTVSAQTGATLGDSKFDIDGGIGVLLSYASKGRKELPDDVILVDGGIDTLGRSGQFVAQHILTTRPGVAVQINAFNFPVWGPLEKFAPAFLAGVPSIIKPATGTAQLTARLVEHMVASGALPEGSVQLICGGIGDLFDHLNEQDSVAFTGSAATALKLRMHPAINAQAVRFNAEADSVNCSILGPDATPDTPAFAARNAPQSAGPSCPNRSLVPSRKQPRRRWPRCPSATPATPPSGWAHWPAWPNAKKSAAPLACCSTRATSPSVTPTWSRCTVLRRRATLALRSRPTAALHRQLPRRAHGHRPRQGRPGLSLTVRARP